MPKIIKSNYGFLIPFFVSILSFWWWRILDISILLGILIFALAAAFYAKKIYLSYILLLLISVLIFKQGFDKTIFITGDLENSNIRAEEIFYASGFGKLYRNRVGVFLYKVVSPPISKIERNFFYNLDPNQYFFAGHPRERTDGLEFDKFSALLLPFFLIGIYLVIKKPDTPWLLFIGVSLLLGSFVSPSYILGPVLLYPVLIFFISTGLKQSFSWSKNIFYRL